MADEVKAKRAASLSAARKKLKEHQQNLKNQTNKQSAKTIAKVNAGTKQYINSGTPASQNETPVDSMASSTHSLFNSTQDQQIVNPGYNVNVTSPLNLTGENGQNYFNTALFQGPESNHLLTNYFDTLSKNTNDSIDAFSPNAVVTQNDHTNQYFENVTYAENQNVKYADPFEIASVQSTANASDNKSESIITEDRTTMEDPELVHDEIFNFANQVAHDNIIKQINTHYSPTLPDRIESESALENITTNTVITNFDNQKNSLSNTESLRQLSSQLNSLIDSSETVQNVSENSELERRNQELAALLDNERLKTEQLNLQLREYMTRVTQLETESQQIRNEQESKLSREVGPLQEQLQYHVQTVGILVGEKTELTMALNQSQTTAKQKNSECEELQGRLRASRHRVGELEKEVNFLKAARENIDKNDQEHSRESERLKLEYNMLKEQFNEITEESAELREKLNVKLNESLILQQEIQDKNSQLSLAQLRIQQLTVGENMQAESQLETLNQHKISLEQQIIELTQTVKLVSAERDQASQQYQQYVQQLNAQLENLAGQLQSKNIETENLSKREQSLIKHISELEKHLQQLQTEKQNQLPVSKINESSAIVIKELEESINSLQTEKVEIDAKLFDEINKREVLEKELSEKTFMVEELETMVERLKVDQPDAGKLLAAMESDKVAAARAVEQNNKLKQQLEELHEGFIKMSNSKLELTEKLETEQHHCRELSEKLSHRETDIEHLHTTISFKDKELMELQSLKTDLNKQILQQTQLLDRLRHYEAQGNVMNLLQQELKESNKNLETVMAENIELNQLVAELNKENHTETKEQNIIDKETTDGAANEINEGIKQKIEYLEKTNADLEKRIHNINTADNNSEQEIKNAQYLDKEKAMEQLEERFKKTIDDVADLTEEKQRLEHLVLQLQSETETIGEYVTLYQCQRALLKQKTLEKDEQLQRLAHDREEMRFKLEELNNLVRKLVMEKGDIPEELLQHKLLKNYNNYCEIHGKTENIEEAKKEEIRESKAQMLNETNNENNNLDTAGKIIALLSEMKTSSLVQSGDSIENFHPCPWCSGKLITV